MQSRPSPQTTCGETWVWECLPLERANPRHHERLEALSWTTCPQPKMLRANSRAHERLAAHSWTAYPQLDCLPTAKGAPVFHRRKIAQAKLRKRKGSQSLLSFFFDLLMISTKEAEFLFDQWTITLPYINTSFSVYHFGSFLLCPSNQTVLSSVPKALPSIQSSPWCWASLVFSEAVVYVYCQSLCY